MRDAGLANSKVIHDENYQIKSSSNFRVWRRLKFRLFSLCVSFISALLAINTINPSRILSCYTTFNPNIEKRETKPLYNEYTTRGKCRMTWICGTENRAALSVIVKIHKSSIYVFTFKINLCNKFQDSRIFILRKYLS